MHKFTRATSCNVNVIHKLKSAYLVNAAVQVLTCFSGTMWCSSRRARKDQSMIRSARCRICRVIWQYATYTLRTCDKLGSDQLEDGAVTLPITHHAFEQKNDHTGARQSDLESRSKTLQNQTRLLILR
ncbi:hypothetical protein NLU13_3060 [Sarocladium strictum]|uniref:Uncharacterized protein n=1 Tax=Sarocladium strictum TaxID=5046 RepID=A0AA39GLA6_SARSR|nr:hypothetical protein NLU13_3060 [Sarocladium strictum]